MDLDGLNYLAGKTMDFVNKSAMNGTILAHTDGQVPNLKVNNSGAGREVTWTVILLSSSSHAVSADIFLE